MEQVWTKECMQIGATGWKWCWIGSAVISVCKGEYGSVLMAIKGQNSNQLVEGTTQEVCFSLKVLTDGKGVMVGGVPASEP